MRPFASVIMTTCNKAPYLSLTLASLANQSFKDFEIILIDDGSTDNTLDVIAKYSNLVNMNASSQVNRGRAYARNQGLKRAEGEVILFCDDDLIAAPDYFELIYNIHKAEGTRVLTIDYLKSALTIVPSKEEWERIPLSVVDAMNLMCHHPNLLNAKPGMSLVSEDQVRLDFQSVIEAKSVEEHGWGRYLKGPEVFAEFGASLSGLHVPWYLAKAGNVCLSTKEARKIGGFDEAYVGWGMEDTDFCYRAYQHGLSFQTCSKAIKYHQLHPSVWNEERFRSNLTHFLNKFDSLEAQLYSFLFNGNYSIREINALIDELPEGNSLVRRALTHAYKKIASTY